MAGGRPSVRIGELNIDRLTFAQTLEAIDALVLARRGGAVFTPNVDHVVMAEEHAAFRLAYANADLRLADGKPLLWASRLLGEPLPEKVSGSDLVLPLMDLAAARSWRVYLLGAKPGVGDKAARVMRGRRVIVVGVEARRRPARPRSGNAKQLATRRTRCG